MGEEEMPSPSLLLASYSRQVSRAGQRLSEQESYFCSSPAAAFRRAGPVPHLSSTGQLTLLLGLGVSQTQGCTHGRASLASCLLCGGQRSSLLPLALTTGSRQES